MMLYIRQRYLRTTFKGGFKRSDVVEDIPLPPKFKDKYIAIYKNRISSEI